MGKRGLNGFRFGYPIPEKRKETNDRCIPPLFPNPLQFSVGDKTMITEFNEKVSVRNVQLTGGTSLMITLPKEWTELIGLQKADRVVIIHRKDGSLSLYPADMVAIMAVPKETLESGSEMNSGPAFRPMEIDVDDL